MEPTSLHPTDRALPPGLWRRKGFVVLLLALLAPFLGVVLMHLRGGERSARLALRELSLVTVSRGVFHDQMPLRAHVRPRNTVYLDSQAGGRVERVLARAGDTVTDGQLLVELSNSQWQLDVLEREARIVESVSQLESYQTQLEQNRIANQRAAALISYDIVRLRRSLDRRRSLEPGMEPVEKLDQTRDELDYNQQLQPLQQESNLHQEQLRTEQLPQIRAQLQALQQDLQMTHAQLDKLLVRSPIQGRLTSLSAEVGENHTAGTRFGEVTPDQGFKLTAAVDEYFLGRVHAGQSASVPIRDQVAALRVERVYPQVKNGNFEVDLGFDATAPPDLTPGETVQGRLTLGSDRPALVLASGPFMDQTAGEYVFVLDAQKRTATRRRITIGRRNAEQLEILDGLREGDTVLISSYEHLERLDRLDITG